MPPLQEVDIQSLPFRVQMKHQPVQFLQEVGGAPEVEGEKTEMETKKPEVENLYPEVQVFTALWATLYVQASQVTMEMRVFMMENNFFVCF